MRVTKDKQIISAQHKHFVWNVCRTVQVSLYKGDITVPSESILTLHIRDKRPPLQQFIEKKTFKDEIWKNKILKRVELTNGELSQL
jgi:hypothetical protein